jgi:dTDP-4-dehydrorhamnose reductase
MRLLILGATGMFGSALHRVLAASSDLETWGTLRDRSALRFFEPADHPRLLTGVDVTDSHALTVAFATARPDVVINAVGVVKQLAAADDPLQVLPINALLPHRLAALCAVAGARLVHVSTDCVFSGRRGGYTEDDPSDAEDLYGKSKAIGEVVDQPHVLTLRTSGIGHELTTRLGLVEWFLSAKGPVKGYRRAIYTGLPWTELAAVIRDHVLPRPDLHGLLQVSSDPISKHDLLRLIAQAYGRPTVIVPDDAVAIDRSLDSGRFRTRTGYAPPPWPELVARMHAARPQEAVRA